MKTWNNLSESISEVNKLRWYKGLVELKVSGRVSYKDR